MEDGKEFKEIKVVFVYSDKLKRHIYGLAFDDDYSSPLYNVNTSDFGEIKKIEVKNNETTNLKLVAEPEKGNKIIFAEKNFPFEESVIYYLQIISGKYDPEINITEYNPIKDKVYDSQK